MGTLTEIKTESEKLNGYFNRKRETKQKAIIIMENDLVTHDFYTTALLYYIF